jgi:putative isomerase
MWPLVVGAASPKQARRVIHGHLMNPDRFLCEHPVATVALDDPRFELRMYRGPAWNSMTYWAAIGCMNYGAHAEAAVLLERALNDTATQFERTGTIWEFYHPHGGRPEDLQRKPNTEFNRPCPDYLGHNPVLAMARLYEQAKSHGEVEPGVPGDACQRA